MAQRSPSIGVVGGGLAGMAASVALTRAGFDVQVFERAHAWGEVGAGINISPNATRALEGMGLTEALAAVGNVMSGQLMRSLSTGEVVNEMILAGDPADSGRFGAPYYIFHRADLIEVLANAVPNIHLDHQLVDLEEGDEGATVIFANGRRETFDVVIGADGIRSRVRQVLYGDDTPTYLGQTAWRAFVDPKEIQDPEAILGKYGFSGWAGRGNHLMTYFMRGKSLINLVGQNDSSAWTEEGWSIPASADAMREVFAEGIPDVQRLLAPMTSVSKWGLFGRKPTHNWGRGRVQLIGDAAHPMLPNAGQGAAQSFEDAYILGRWLAEEKDIDTALASFREVRIPRAHAIQRQSALNNARLHSGSLAPAGNGYPAPPAPKGGALFGMGWIYDFNPTEQWSERVSYPLSNASDEIPGRQAPDSL